MTVFIYVNTSRQIYDKNHLKVFANADAAETCFEENEPKGFALLCKQLARDSGYTFGVYKKGPTNFVRGCMQRKQRWLRGFPSRGHTFNCDS